MLQIALEFSSSDWNLRFTFVPRKSITLAASLLPTNRFLWAKFRARRIWENYCPTYLLTPETDANISLISCELHSAENTSWNKSRNQENKRYFHLRKNMTVVSKLTNLERTTIQFNVKISRFSITAMTVAHSWQHKGMLAIEEPNYGSSSTEL